MADTAETVEVTKDEADQRQFDALAITNPDPAFHYRWARKRDINMARHKFNGYEVVDSTSDKVRSILTDGTRMKKGEDTSTMVEVSDMVLMRTPRANHERIIREREDKIRRQTRSVAASYKRAVGQIAGPGNAYEEHQDNKQMRGMSEKAHDKLQAEQNNERKRELERLGLKG